MTPAFCRLLVKAEIFADLASLQSRAQNPLSVSQALFQNSPVTKASANTQAVTQPVVINLLVSLACEARISALLRKVEGDYRRKTQQAIKCKQLLVQDCFEIVDVYKSQVQHYLTDLMHVTVLALRIADKD